MDWLQKISITCFAASYGVVFALEASRMFFQTKLRTVLRLGLTAAGLFAHTVYIVYHTQSTIGSDGIWLGSWLGWGLAVAWMLAASYLWLTVQKPKSLIGLFLLPVTLLLILVSASFGDASSFSPSRAKTIWNLIHGSALLLGTVAVALGFVFSVMYLINARRLKQKLTGWFNLPSLEWLQSSAERSLAISTLLFGCGLASGIALVMVKQSTKVGVPSIPWSDPVIWSSAILFLWLLATTVFSVVYKPARQGKKIAWLVTVSFLFLLVELMIVLQFGHATPDVVSTGWESVPHHVKLTLFFAPPSPSRRTNEQYEGMLETPHPPTPSPRDFGGRLISMDRVKVRNLEERGSKISMGFDILVFLMHKNPKRSHYAGGIS